MLAIGIHHLTGFVGSRHVQMPIIVDGISPVIVQPDKAMVANLLRGEFQMDFDTYLVVQNDQVVHHWESQE